MKFELLLLLFASKTALACFGGLGGGNDGYSTTGEDEYSRSIAEEPYRIPNERPPPPGENNPDPIWRRPRPGDKDDSDLRPIIQEQEQIIDELTNERDFLADATRPHRLAKLRATRAHEKCYQAACSFEEPQFDPLVGAVVGGRRRKRQLANFLGGGGAAAPAPSASASGAGTLPEIGQHAGWLGYDSGPSGSGSSSQLCNYVSGGPPADPPELRNRGGIWKEPTPSFPIVPPPPPPFGIQPPSVPQGSSLLGALGGGSSGGGLLGSSSGGGLLGGGTGGGLLGKRKKRQLAGGFGGLLGGGGASEGPPLLPTSPSKQFGPPLGLSPKGGSTIGMRSWKIFSGPIGDRNHGVPGPHPYGAPKYAGAYLMPTELALMEAPVDFFDDDYYVQFDFFEPVPNIRMKMCCDTLRECPFVSYGRQKTRSPRKWTQKNGLCQRGTKKLIFLCENLGPSHGACAIDSITLLTRDGLKLCEGVPTGPAPPINLFGGPAPTLSPKSAKILGLLVGGLGGVGKKK